LREAFNGPGESAIVGVDTMKQAEGG
jgi:hypothetical protein